MIKRTRHPCGRIYYRMDDGEALRGEDRKCATCLTEPETAAALGISHQAVNYTIKKALYKIRQALAPYASPNACEAEIDRELLICWARRMGPDRLREMSAPKS